MILDLGMSLYMQIMIIVKLWSLFVVISLYTTHPSSLNTRS